jgi:beta-N-acetylhexosaminidase
VQDRVQRITEKKKEFFKDYKPIYIPDIEKKVNLKTSQAFLEDIKKKILEKNNQK